MPGIPAPPGEKQAEDSQGTRVAVNCSEAEFCSLGRAADEGEDLLCPAVPARSHARSSVNCVHAGTIHPFTRDKHKNKHSFTRYRPTKAIS